MPDSLAYKLYPLAYLNICPLSDYVHISGNVDLDAGLRARQSWDLRIVSVNNSGWEVE
jgi:hypothetical protein